MRNKRVSKNEGSALADNISFQPSRLQEAMSYTCDGISQIVIATRYESRLVNYAPPLSHPYP